MKLLKNIKKNKNNLRVGALKNENIVDLSEASLPKNMIEFISLGHDGLDKATDYVESQVVGFSPDDIEIKAPIKTPNKILAVGLNYKKHIEEAKDLKDHHSKEVELQDQFPNIFNKQNSSVNDPFGKVHRPNASDWLDYEGEMGFVIGKNCRHVSYDDAEKCIYGYTIVNDFTIRDWQFRGPPHTMTMGKSWDTHCPFGPYIVTSDEIDDPHNLNLRTYVNDEERQKRVEELLEKITLLEKELELYKAKYRDAVDNNEYKEKYRDLVDANLDMRMKYKSMTELNWDGNEERGRYGEDESGLVN